MIQLLGMKITSHFSNSKSEVRSNISYYKKEKHYKAKQISKSVVLRQEVELAKQVQFESGGQSQPSCSTFISVLVILSADSWGEALQGSESSPHLPPTLFM